MQGIRKSPVSIRIIYKPINKANEDGDQQGDIRRDYGAPSVDVSSSGLQHKIIIISRLDK